MDIHVTLQSLSDVLDDHGNSMDGALNQEPREPGSKPSTAIDSLCDLRRRSLHSGLQLPHLTGRLGPDKFSTQSLSALTFGGVTQWTKLKTAPPTPPVSGPQCFKPVSECWCPLVTWAALYSLPEILGGMQVNIHTYRRLLNT